MSVLVVGKFQGDSAKFRESLETRAEEFAAIAEHAKTLGAIHHRFGIGDGVVVVIDEWETAEQFQSFMSDPKMHEFIGSVGAAPGPPETLITEAVSSADEF